MSEPDWPWWHVPAFPARVLGARQGRQQSDIRRESRRHMGHELVADCEAFLSGDYVERVVAQSGGVPTWAWTNLLAHGSEDQLHDEARRQPRSGPSLRRWYEARAYLATELLAAARRGTPLVRLQREVLVPLELELGSRPGAEYWLPQEWVAAVRTALDEHRQASRR